MRTFSSNPPDPTPITPDLPPGAPPSPPTEAPPPPERAAGRIAPVGPDVLEAVGVPGMIG